MSTLTRTGVFARPEQVKRMRSAVNMPAILVGGVERARSSLQVAHDCALACGLPEIEGYYGCDLSTGEFVTTSTTHG